MIKPALPDNEPGRLEALASYHLMDTPPEKDFDDLAKVASQICQVPIALVTLMAGERHWFKAHHGTDILESPREISFCGHALLQIDRPLVVPDLTLDERFWDNPLVTGPTQVIFYAGVPLVNPEGFAIGTLCVIDHKPNQLADSQLEALKALANQAMAMMELRRKVSQLEQHRRQLDSANRELSEISYVLSHDIRSPLNSISSLLEIIQEECGHQLDNNGKELLDMTLESAHNLHGLVKNTLEYFKTLKSLDRKKEAVHLPSLLPEVLSLLALPAWAEVRFSEELPSVTVCKFALTHILLNLVSNAVKYSDEEKCVVEIHFSEDDSHYILRVSDNGPGIPEAYTHKVFKLFQTLGREDRFGQKGTGLGLGLVKRMVEEIGGSIALSRPAGKGACFEIMIAK